MYFGHFQNWLPWVDAEGGLRGADHLWSLAIEEQFYLIWPLIIFFARPDGLRRICMLVIALSIFSKGVLLLSKAPTGMLYVATITRLDALAMGAFVATLTVQQAAKYASLAKPLAIICIAFLVWVIAILPAELFARKAVCESTLAALIFGYLVLQIRAQKISSSVQILLSSSSLNWLGKHSYSLYLVHFPVIFYVRQWIHDWLPGMSFNLVSLYAGTASLLLALPLGMLSYRFVEAPMLRLRDQRFSGDKRAAPSGRMNGASQ